MSDISIQGDISPQELEQLTAVNPTDIRFSAMNLLARREHSSKELRQKLLKRFDEPALVDEQLLRLTEENLQSDERFAESYLRQRISRGRGPISIRQEMRRKGISDTGIQLAINAEQPDWYALAKLAFYRKFGNLPAEDIKEKAKRSRFMQYRGFEHDHFQHLLN
ncbi:MAG: regulatory protein RecX [Halioglobus sp.]|nr:regulatory protein RecX [Halioglobus sp.]MDG2326751.1 regulatory protein RecX [Halioglobus sp.]